jgi:16S rRNA (guanine1516-N2)-methyltransferase
MSVDAVLLECGDPQRAGRVADRLGVPVVDEAQPGWLVLAFTSARVELRAVGPQGAGPVFIDFSSGEVPRRAAEPGSSRTPLARAVGATKGRRPLVVDATAGLGVDAALLAGLGCEVMAVDRSPIVAALFRDALQRGGPPGLRFVEGDARALLEQLTGSGAAPDVVYLDPMFPARKKRALVKKKMQLLQRALDDAPDDATALVAAARETSARVVVKRPKGAAALAASPSSVVPAGSVRFDVYV